MKFPSTGRSHRTALLVDLDQVNGDNKHTFLERVGRLFESLNGDNIKTDLYAAKEGVVTRVSNIDTVHSLLSGAQASTDNEQDFRSWASELGYDQILVDTPQA